MATKTTAVGETNRKATKNTSITKGSKKRENTKCIKYSQPVIEASKPKYNSGGSSALFQSRIGKGFRRPIYSKHNLRRVSDRVCTATSKVFEGYNYSSSPGGGKEIMYDIGINSLLEKRAIEIVPNSQIKAGFYSTVFLVEKKTGGYRMVLNLKSLNKFIRTQLFKMETLRSDVHSLDIGDWVFSFDL